MRRKVVIDKIFNNVETMLVPENFADFTELCLSSNFKIEFCHNKNLEDIVLAKNIIFYETGKVGVVTGVNEVKIVARNRSASQMWQIMCGLMEEQK